MREELKALQGNLARKYLGKRGIHGIHVDEKTQTVNVYVEQKDTANPALAKLRKDVGSLDVQTIESPRARLA